MGLMFSRRRTKAAKAKKAKAELLKAIDSDLEKINEHTPEVALVQEEVSAPVEAKPKVKAAKKSASKKGKGKGK